MAWCKVWIDRSIYPGCRRRCRALAASPYTLQTPFTGAGGAAEPARRGAGASLPEGRGGGGPGYDMNLVQYAAEGFRVQRVVRVGRLWVLVGAGSML